MTTEFNSLVAEKVLGLYRFTTQDGRRIFEFPQNYVGNEDQLPMYSTIIRSAWDVVDHMSKLGWKVSIDDCNGDVDPKDRWRAEFKNGEESHSAYAESAPMAICMAALEAVGGLAE